MSAYFMNLARYPGRRLARIPALKVPLGVRYYRKESDLGSRMARQEHDLDEHWRGWFTTPLVAQRGQEAPDPDAAIYKDWYTSPLVGYPWSCDWSVWCGVRWFAENRVETNYNEGFNIPEKIEPVAYIPAGGGGAWAFKAGRKYYFYEDDDDVLFRYDGEFASPDEFFRWWSQGQIGRTAIRRSALSSPPWVP
ncbi:hypothetical protein FB451DRAFT_1452884 [Mycena latifolia]|nr:hypothetical protein FB451DRAFT_1452884 [Mycena latifolia]